MKRLWASKLFRAVAGLLAVLCLAALLAGSRYRIWSYADYQTYEEVRRYPIGEELWFGRATTGLDLAAFTADHPPHRTRQMGRYTVLNYYAVWPTPPGSIQMESLSVVAENGRLVQAVAVGCTWHRAFFEMSSDSAAEFDQAWERYHGRVSFILVERSVPRIAAHEHQP